MRRAAREVKRRSAGTARLGDDWEEEEAVEGGRAELADEEQAVAAGAGAAAAAGAISPRGGSGASLPSSLRKPLHLWGKAWVYQLASPPLDLLRAAEYIYISLVVLQKEL